MSSVFPDACDGVSFLCWILDQRGLILHARDFLCGMSTVRCDGSSLTTVRPRVASVLVASGVFQMHIVDGLSSEIVFMHRDPSYTNATVRVSASYVATALSSQQNLEVNVFSIPQTTATVAVLSGSDMQVRLDIRVNVFDMFCVCV